MESVQEDFPSHFRSVPPLPTIAMQELSALTLANPLKLDQTLLTIDGWFATINISSGSIDAILMSSLLPLSKQSSTFSNMSTRVMTIPLWSLAPVSMKSSSTWIHDMSAAARQIGIYTSLRCIIMNPVFCVLQFTFLIISRWSFILTEMQTFSRPFKELKTRIPLSLDGLKPMHFIGTK